MEFLPELEESLKEAQSRAKTLSTNFAQLMRLVQQEELEAVDREITQVRSGTHEALKEKYKEALRESERKKSIARSRLIYAEHEIDSRFQGMVDIQWSQFKVRFDGHSELTIFSMIRRTCEKRCARKPLRPLRNSIRK